ncbi:MAG TPA: tripartite tricarboxylate transporter substrate-binding protein [Beijerinckiaceae bacterium]|nr:tripartite tricarboxylate transporter substrate-binding protein [Beijerinckiaceae bacterium]
MTSRIRFLSLLACALLSPFAARADGVADFYKGKQINLVVGYGPGGGYDVYARIVARHLTRQIPGNPTVVVQNMPGAGSLRAANYLYNAAPKDGTVIGTFARNMALLGVLGSNANVQFDPRKFTWLGSSSSYENDAYLLFVHKDAPVKSIEDARKPGGPPIVLGGTADGTSGNDVAMVQRDALGLNLKMITGYPDSNALFLAVDRKEIDGRNVGISAVNSSKAEWLGPNSNVRVLMQFARRTRHPRFPDVPTARELARSAADRALIELAEMPYLLSRPFVAPPGLPADRAKALQAAFLATHRDPDFLADADKLKIDVSPIGAERVVELITQIASAPPDQLKYIEKLISEN